MFQPQPTPFASTFLAAPPLYGLLDTGHDLDLHLQPPLPLSTPAGGRPGAVNVVAAAHPAGPQYASHAHYQNPHEHDAQLKLSPQTQHLQLQQKLLLLPHHPRNLHQLQHGDAHPYSPVIKMEDQDQHGLAAQQAAARDYEPVYEGSMVGDKTNIVAITQSYAKADPVYVEKTITLPQTYSHYRPIRGDGNCGWRAIGFAYYERLIDVGDQGQIEGEVARLTSLNHMIGSAGGYQYFEDFADEAIGLLRDVAASIANPDVARLLVHQRWNDGSTGPAIIYYLRLLTATYLKTNEANYAGFIPDLGVQGYCSQSVELPDREIEHIGLDALANVLLKPVNLVIEVAYLDRTPGSEVNHYRFPAEANGQDPSNLGPIIHLLFRPDHYDILYHRDLPITPAASTHPTDSVNMQVHRVASFSHNTEITGTRTDLGAFSTVDFGTLSMLPGFSTGVAGISPMSSSTAPSPHVEQYFPSQVEGQWAAIGSRYSPQQQQPPPQPAPVVAAPPPPTPSAVPLASDTSSQILGQPAPAARPGFSFRFSPVQLEYEETKGSFPEATFDVTTTTFRNSVYNRAHYGNPAFHPEEWRPEDDSIEARVGGGRRRIRKDS